MISLSDFLKFSFQLFQLSCLVFTKLGTPSLVSQVLMIIMSKVRDWIFGMVLWTHFSSKIYDVEPMQCGHLRNVALSFWLIRILDECHCCDYVISTVHVSFGRIQMLGH